MGLCQGKQAPIEPSNGPAPVRQAAAASTPSHSAAPAANAAPAAIKCTDDQINKFIELGKIAYSKRTWSDKNASKD